MAAYATPQLELASRSSQRPSHRAEQTRRIDPATESSLLDTLIDQLAERLAERLAAAADPSQTHRSSSQDEWFDSRHAADYLGVHRDTLRKLAAQRAIPAEQDGPNCKLHFRRSDLDAWRRTGGRPRHLATSLRHVA